MQNLSQNTLKGSKNEYFRVLKKCFLINIKMLAILILISPIALKAQTIVTPSEELETIVKTTGTTVSKDTTIDLAGKNLTYTVKQSSSYGGVFYVNSGKTLEFINSDETTDPLLLFENNSISRSPYGEVLGGAIYNWEDITFDVTTAFSKNTLSTTGNGSSWAYGGAIYNGGTIMFEKEVTFTDNAATAEGDVAQGGAIYNDYGTITFNDIATFSGNSVGGPYAQGGVIYNEGTMIFKESTFTKNSGKYGGAIYNGVNYGSEQMNITFDGYATFTENLANIGGTNKGGAIYNAMQGTITFNQGALFDKNISTTGQGSNDILGGAIYNEGTIIFSKDVIFNENAAVTHFTSSRSKGGAIYNNSGTITFSGNVDFSGNFADGDDASGGAIYNGYNGTITFGAGSTATFSGNEASSVGGAIYNSGSITFNNDSIFSSNFADGDDASGGAIYNGYNGTITFGAGSTATFSGNEASSKGGAIYNSGSITFNNDSIFSSNFADGDDASGGAIYNSGSITFGAIAEFTDNFVDGSEASGGAIYHRYGTTITFNNGATFSSNSVTGFSSSSDGLAYGGAIYNTGTITFGGNVDFIDNFVDSDGAWGGAIYNNSGTITFGETSTLKFVNNTANGEENDIYNEKGTINILGEVKSPIHLISQSGTIGLKAKDIDGDGKVTYGGSYDLNDTLLDISEDGIKALTIEKLILDNVTLKWDAEFKNLGDTYTLLQDTINASVVGNFDAGSVILNGDKGKWYDIVIADMQPLLKEDAIVDFIIEGLYQTKDMIYNEQGVLIGFSINFVDTTGLKTLGEVVRAGEPSSFDLSHYGLTGNEQVVTNYVVTDKDLQANGSMGELGSGQKTIIGATTKAKETIIDANGVGSLFKLGTGDILNISNLTIKNAKTAIYNYNNTSGKVTLNTVDFTNNSSSTGGAIYNYYGTITFGAGSTATFSGNEASDDGGAIINYYGTITFGESSTATFSGNTASRDDGGSIYNSGDITFGEGSTATFSGNKASKGSGGAIYSYGDITFGEGSTATFSGNEATYGGAIDNDGDITFGAGSTATFTGNTASSEGGAVYNRGTITFNNASTFSSNSATGFGSSSNGAWGGAIYNGGTITFNGESAFTNNSTTSFGGAIYNYYGTITFNDSFLFSDNTSSHSDDIYNGYYSTITFANKEGTVGSLDGGIYQSNGVINKTGKGTLILGDLMVNGYGSNSTFEQTEGLTIAKTDKLNFAASNTISGGELRVHGDSLENLTATVSKNAMLTYLTTNAAEQTVGLGGVTMNGGTLVLGAYTAAEKQSEVDLVKDRKVPSLDEDGNIVYDEEGNIQYETYKVTEKLLTSNTVDRANYALNGDIAGAGKVTFKDSDIKLGANSYTGVYEIGATNTIDMKDNSSTEKTVSFTNLTGEGAKLALDVIFIKETDGSVAMTADKLTVTGSNYEFGGVELNWVGKDLLNTWVDDMALDQDGNMNPTIVHTATILSGGASLKSGSETFLSTASPYSYMVSIGAQTLTVSASKLAEGVTPLEYLVNYAGDSTLQFDAGSGALNASKVLEPLSTGTKTILGASDDASERVIEGVGQNLFKVDKAGTTLEMKDLTIKGVGTFIDNQAGSVALDNVIIKDTVGDTALKNGSILSLKDVVVDKGVVNSGKLTMSGNNALSTLTNSGETMVEGGKLSVTTLGGNGTLTMNGAELDSTNIATNNTIVSNGMSLSNGLTTFEVKSLEVKDGTTLDLNLAMTTADKIKNEGDMIANKDLSVGALEGTGTLTVNNATLDVADKFTTTNKIVANNMTFGDKVTSEIHFADLEIAKDSTLDIKTLQATANTLTVRENATLGITLNGLDEYGTMKAEEIFAENDAKVHLSLGDNFSGGVFDVFKGSKGAGDLELVHNNVYNVVEMEEGKYSFMPKDKESLQESLGTTEIETDIANALTGGTSTDNAQFEQAQKELLVGLQSQNKGTVLKAKRALNALGARSTSIYQAQATAQFTQMHTLISQMLMNATAPIFGHAGGEDPARATVYVKGLYDRVNSLAGDGFRMRSKGAVLGVQSALTEDLTVGIGYAGVNTIAKEDLRRTEVNTNTGFISAQYQPNNWWMSGVLTYSRSQYEEEKQVLSTKGKATYDVDSVGAQITTGYNIHLSNWIITPEIGVRYLNARQEGYTDSIGTTVERTNSDFVTAMGGFKVGVDLKWIRPLAGVMVGYDVITDDITSINTLSNGRMFTIQGKALDRLSTTVVAGFSADLDENTTLKLEYSGNYRKEYLDHSGMIRLEYRF